MSSSRGASSEPGVSSNRDASSGPGVSSNDGVSWQLNCALCFTQLPSFARVRSKLVAFL